MSILAGVAAKGAIASIKKNYEWIILGAILIVGGLLVASLWVGKAQAEKALAEEVAAHAKSQAAYADERTKAATAYAAKVKEYQDLADSKQKALDESEARNAKLKVDFDNAVRDFGGTRKRLLDQLTRYANYAAGASAAAQPDPSCGPVLERLGTVGSLYSASDETAGACAERYGKCKQRLDRSLGYIEAVSPKH